jgi:hypothetical protein
MNETWSYRCQYIRCGKGGCSKCPHGPYWYGFRSEKGKTRSKYFGKKDPRGESSERINAPTTEAFKHPWGKILSARTASAEIAGEILGVFMTKNKDLVHKRYRELVREHHPDRGGDHDVFVLIGAAYSYLCKLYGW